MTDDLQLNVPLLRRRVPNLTTAARAVGLRPATVSNLCTGKIPVGRAEVRTLVALASLAGCSLDELIIRRSGLGMMIETGIKVLDLFAPFVRGGTIGFVARTGVGQLVLLAEVLRRVKERRGFATIVWLPGGANADSMAEVVSEAEYTCTSLDEVYNQISTLRSERDVFLAADRTVLLCGELFELRERLQEAGSRPVTIALVDSQGGAVDEEAPYGPLDTLLQFDVELGARRMYPAVDPVISTSTLLEGAQLEANHLALQQKARKLLRHYRELRSLVNVSGLEKLPATEVPIYRRGERLEAFLSQPFYVAEQFTNQAGQWLPLQDTLDGVRQILDGAADDLDVSQLAYTGRLVLN